MKINQYLDKIDQNHLFVPAFQREYVWKRDNAKNLIASLLRRYPVGTLLTWETNTPPELKGEWKYDSVQGAVKVLLDGQQRLTTLYILIKDKIPPFYKDSEIIHDPRGTDGLYINIKTLELQYFKKTLMEKNPYWIDVTAIFQKTIRERDAIRAIEDSGVTLSREDEDALSDNFRAVEYIPEIDFLEQSIPIKASLKEAIDIFYIVNASGVNLTDAELALAQISGYWPEAREIFKRKLAQLKEQGFEFKLDFIVYCLLGMLYQMGSDMTKLHDPSNSESLHAAWEKLDTEVLDYLVNLLRSHAYVDHTKEINSVFALVPIVVYIAKKGVNALSQDDINRIVKWFYYSQLRYRYVSQTPQKLDKDIGIVMRSESPFDELLNNIGLERPLEITPEEFEGAGVRNALYSLMRWYFKSNNAVCFTTGIKIRQTMGRKYALEWDHIFPFSVLKEHGYNYGTSTKYALAQEITNRAIITQLANRQKSDDMAATYLQEVQQKMPQALKLQCIPENEELWKLENFELFLRERRKMLAEQLNSFLNNITVTNETVGTVSVEDLIAEGESSGLEIKSSLRWNYTEAKIDKRMEDVIMKAIAALSNADGGTIIIGVDDDSTVLGLDKDYDSVHGSRDEYELFLRDLISTNYGKLVTSTIGITFHSINDLDVCKIDVPKGDEALFLNVMDKNGQKQDKFYLRVGNSSQELGMADASVYIKGRF